MTPLLHSNLLPDFKQVNFFPSNVENAPTFLQVAPALTAAKEGTERDEPINARAIRIPRGFFFMLGIILSNKVQAKGLGGSELPPHVHKNPLS